MSQQNTYPYLRPQPIRFNQEPWQIEIDGKFELLQEALPMWDPSMPIHAVTTVTLDVSGIYEDCSLAEGTELRLGAGWYSPGSNLKGAGSRTRIERQPEAQIPLQVNVDGSLLANQIMLQIFLVAIESGGEREKLAPQLPGSTLWESEQLVHLEGIAARFPTELIDFESADWLPPHAVWFLDWNPDDFRMPVTAAVRLFINSGNERVKKAVSGGPSEDSAIREAITFDVARLLIHSALCSGEFMTTVGQFQKGSIGFAIHGLVRMLFPRMSLAELRRLLDEPNRFDTTLQDGLRLFRKI